MDLANLEKEKDCQYIGKRLKLSKED